MNKTNLLKKIIKERILFLDDIMGAMIQKYKLSEYDFRGNLFNDKIKSNKINNLISSIKKIDIKKYIYNLASNSFL